MITQVHRKNTGYFSSQELTRNKRRIFNFSRSRLPGLILVVFFLYLVISFGLQINKLYAMQHELLQIQKQMADLEDKNAKLREQLELVQSDAYIEQMAREKLGLVKQGESRIISVDSEKKQ